MYFINTTTEAPGGMGNAITVVPDCKIIVE